MVQALELCLLRGREGTAQVPEMGHPQLAHLQQMDGVLPPQPAPFRVVEGGNFGDTEGVGAAGAEGDNLRCVVVVVLVGAQHQVPGQAQRGKARDVVVLIGVQHHGEVPAGQGKAGVAVPTYRQLFHGKTSLWSGISRSLCPYCTIFPGVGQKFPPERGDFPGNFSLRMEKCRRA